MSQVSLLLPSASHSASSTSFLTAQEEPSPDIHIYDLVIVGGGVSGLVTAYRVLEKVPSLRVAILEAENRLGGQLYTTELGEIGARWVSRSHRHLMDLCDELKCPLVEKYDGDYSLQRHWEIQTFLEHFEVRQFVTEVDDLCVEYDPQYPSRNWYKTMEDYLTSKLLFKRSKDFVRLLVRATSGKETNQIPVHEFFTLCFMYGGMSQQIESFTGNCSAENFVLPDRGGWKHLYHQLTNRIIHSALGAAEQVPEDTPDPNLLQIFKRKLVLEVAEVRPSNVLIQTQDIVSDQMELWKCNVVVIAVPWPMARNIHFSPSLYRRNDDMADEKIKYVTSFIAQYATPVWRQSGASGEIMQSKPYFISYEAAINTISGFLFHDGEEGSATTFASVAAGVDDEMLKEEILRVLVEHFGVDMRHPCKWLAHTFEQIVWLNREQKRSSSSVVLTSQGLSCQLNGAIYGGNRAAVIALQKLRPQVITYEDVIRIEAQHTTIGLRKVHPLRRWARAWLNLKSLIRLGTGAGVLVLALFAARQTRRWLQGVKTWYHIR